VIDEPTHDCDCDVIDAREWPKLIELFRRLPKDEVRDPLDPEPII